VFFREISRITGRCLFYFSLILLIPLGVAFIYEFLLSPTLHPQPHSTLAFAFTFLVCLLLSGLFIHFGKKASGMLHRRESIFLVVLIWFITGFVGALPFWLSNTLSPLDAYFEAISGLTTTGSTVIQAKEYDPATQKEIPIILPLCEGGSGKSFSFFGTVAPVRDSSGNILFSGVEAVGKALLFWRSMLQWLGGMGIVVLFISVLPALSMGGKFLFETEMPGPNKEAMTPRIKETASHLWKIYLGLTVAQVILLILTNSQLPFFDAVTLSFSTISTGGFSVRNESIGAYHNLHTEQIIILFMILGSINFTLYFYCLKGKIYRIYDPELFSYLLSLFFFSLLLSFNLWNTPKILFGASEGTFSFLEAFRVGSFQAVSAQTSTGFVIGNYDLWPFSAQLLLLFVMFIGGMSGSTAGGTKTTRIYILFQAIKVKIESIFRPYSVRCLKIGEKEVSEKLMTSVLIFISVLVLLAALGTYLLVLDGLDASNAFGIIACMANNAGLSFKAAGPLNSCAFLPPLSKIISILWMVMGRLEYFAILAFFFPAFWKGK